MAKVIYRKAHKVTDGDRIITLAGERWHYISDISRDYSTSEGALRKEQLKKKDGSIVKTTQGKEFTIFSAGFIDNYRKIERKAQIITIKDLGIISAEVGLNKNSKVVDAGAGSGAAACYFAHLCKEVTSYDVRDDALEVARHNKDFLALKNLKLKKGSVADGISEKNRDLVLLDMPEPWTGIDSARKALKVGGFLVVYVPTVLQISQFVTELAGNDSFVHLKTIEVIERDWKVEGRSVRPTSEAIGHTGFITFCRRVR